MANAYGLDLIPNQQQSFVLCVGLKPLNKTLSSLFLQYPLAQVHSMGGIICRNA
jgi:hypothetical protein